MENDTKRMIIIRGLTGSGKTTLADLICDGFEDTEADEKPVENCRISVSSDDYFYDDEGNYKFIPDQIKSAHRWCLNEVESCATLGYEVIVVHNTFTRKWEIDPYVQTALNHGYAVNVVSLHDSGLTDIQLAERSPHGVPVSNIRKQRERWEFDVYRDAQIDTRKKEFRPNTNFRKDSRNFRKPF